MTDQSSQFPKFYMTAPSPCPYLKEKTEKKIFTELNDHEILYDKTAIFEHQTPDEARRYASNLHHSLTLVGFRRSQDIAYRPACEDCNECKSVRIPASLFEPTKSQKRVAKKNTDVISQVKPNVATEEQFQLLKKYVSERHDEGGMSDITIDEYTEMVECSSIQSIIIEYRLSDGTLIGAALTDKMTDSLSMVYSFFDISNEMNKRSFGVYMVLDHIRRANSMNLEHVYLGYWVKNSSKMNYKMKFKPLEVLTSNRWNLIK